MSATHTRSASRGSTLIVLCLLALLASTISVSSPTAVKADGNGDDTIYYEDTLGVGKSLTPDPTDPDSTTDPMLEGAIAITDLLVILWTARW